MLSGCIFHINCHSKIFFAGELTLGGTFCMQTSCPTIHNLRTLSRHLLTTSTGLPSIPEPNTLLLFSSISPQALAARWSVKEGEHSDLSHPPPPACRILTPVLQGLWGTNQTLSLVLPAGVCCGLGGREPAEPPWSLWSPRTENQPQIHSGLVRLL